MILRATPHGSAAIILSIFCRNALQGFLGRIRRARCDMIGWRLVAQARQYWSGVRSVAIAVEQFVQADTASRIGLILEFRRTYA